MGQKLPHCDHRDIQIARLEAELEHAYQIIAQLRWEKTYFQKARTDTVQRGDRRLETPLNSRVSHLPLQRNPDARLKNRTPHPQVKKKSENADSLYLKILSINFRICYLLL